MPRQLQFQGKRSPSLASKISITFWYALGVFAATWFTFSLPEGGHPPGNLGRQVALLACAVTYILRAAATLFVFVKRKIPWWEAAFGGGLIGFVLFAFLSDGLRTPQPLGFVDAVGALLYLTGSYLGTGSEYSRHVWKAHPENQGHLYTEGLFRYSRHINYLGDLLLFGGFAVLTRQVWTGIVPLIMGLNFVLILIPAQDAYLASRYGAEFGGYARRTKKLIPLVY
ncbi:methyltransferase family protein [Gemmatimonadota bacterium]